MSDAVRAHQARALAEARTLEGMAAAPKAVRVAQAKRVFGELKAMTTGEGSDDVQKQVRRRWWWLDTAD
jgi:hypothetical protein